MSHAIASTMEGSSVPDLHHGSHNHLLTDVVPAGETPGDGLDAIVVPTFRESHSLRDALHLARETDCLLVALCSGPAQAAQAVARGEKAGTPVRAIDLHEGRSRMPRFRSDEVLARNDFTHGSDLSLKRNLGLLLGRMAGWRRMLFLDDDIAGVDAAELPGVAAHLDDGRFRAVGLRNAGYPDNSVVCHAYRAIGAEQDSFIGGGAMIVDPAATRSFFPNIYNEDWFFLLGDGVPFRAAVGGQMIQRPYDPFASPRRAVGEELGDLLAEGLFSLLDEGLSLADLGSDFWGRALFRRRGLLDHVLARVDTEVPADRRGPIRASLEAARARSAFINPWLCDAFVDAWRHDLTTWGDFLDQRPAGVEIEKAVADLGLAHCFSRTAA